MNEADLPEPVRPKFSEAEKEERNLRLFTTLFIFISCYSVFHKVLIPFCLSFTKLHPSPYTIIDLSFIHPVVLALLFYKEKGNSKLVSLLAGAAVTYGLLEMLEVLEGHYLGWLSFSRMLSSTPMALLSLFMMTRKFENRNALLGWIGALILLPFYYGKFLFPVTTRTLPEAAQKVPVLEVARSLPKQEIPLCGAMELSLQKDKPNYTVTNKLEIKDCGLTPSYIYLNNSEIFLYNNSKKPQNLHLGYYKNGKVAAGWNVLLPSRQTVKREIKYLEKSVAIIYSDSSTDAGLTAITLKPLESAWNINRKPLMIRESP